MNTKKPQKEAKPFLGRYFWKGDFSVKREERDVRKDIPKRKPDQRMKKSVVRFISLFLLDSAAFFCAMDRCHVHKSYTKSTGLHNGATERGYKLWIVLKRCLFDILKGI